MLNAYHINQIGGFKVVICFFQVTIYGNPLTCLLGSKSHHILASE